MQGNICRGVGRGRGGLRVIAMIAAAVAAALLEGCVANESGIDECMMAINKPEDGAWYKGERPEVEVQLTGGCECVDKV